MKRAISWILDNAVTYGREGGKVSVSVSDIGGRWRIKIDDDGVGIPKKEQSRVFDKFFRASNASLGKNEGSGLSLFLSKMIIEAHGGVIGFSSEEDKGSSFWIDLPIAG